MAMKVIGLTVLVNEIVALGEGENEEGTGKLHLFCHFRCCTSDLEEMESLDLKD